MLATNVGDGFLTQQWRLEHLIFKLSTNEKGDQRFPHALEKALALIQKIFENILNSTGSGVRR